MEEANNGYEFWDVGKEGEISRKEWTFELNWKILDENIKTAKGKRKEK